jgi:hypothetical protein
MPKQQKANELRLLPMAARSRLVDWRCRSRSAEKVGGVIGRVRTLNKLLDPIRLAELAATRRLQG